ncbi:WD-40 repeat protein [Rippkaea orientalis PCC 8801]|uniref:WD-40 repeat protein n=1 Tax=Rippkaea orientalis (strain PCC 8801 / RF-1) TaxID=41431 RepID=B7JYS1_RIPO1|nr:WD40 repeat domain-containing protein [Rippkaea orientalis]ACK64941.1 WD-40 repeat protein [Rippkaea orientalis PCC 8801]
MFNLKPTLQTLFELQWSRKLADYVTDLSWSNRDYLAASSGIGEVLLWNFNTEEVNLILSPEDTQEKSIDCLQFSADGQFLAAAGQEGKVRIWQILPELQLLNHWGKEGQWIEQLAWHPTQNLLAFSIGRYVQIVDIFAEEIIVTLPFESSSVLAIAWYPSGERLAIAGNGGIKIWKNNSWDEEPIVLEMPAACTAIAWSNQGEYLAASCLDNTVLVWRFPEDNPWRMVGFEGKIRQLAWSTIPSGIAPLLAVACQNTIVVWKKQKTDKEGWLSRTLIHHEAVIKNVVFQPNTLLLASVGTDGLLLFWKKAEQLTQSLEGVSTEFSRLIWHPLGKKLALGGANGELLILTQSTRGKGFG